MKTVIVCIFFFNNCISLLALGSDSSHITQIRSIDTFAILNNTRLKHLITEFENSNVETKRTVEEIPKEILLFLDTICGEKFVLANPSEDWQNKSFKIAAHLDTNKNIVIDALKLRSLIAYFSSKDISILSYYTGGNQRAQHILIFEMKNELITDFWTGVFNQHILSSDEILQFLKEYQKNPSVQNANMIYL